MARLGTESAFDILARAEALKAEGRDIINLGIGQPDFPTPPNVVAAAQKALADGHHGYTPANGIRPLREAVAADIAKWRGVSVDPDHILIQPGGKPTMFFAIMMLGEAGTEILYPNPGFPIYESVIRWSGAEAVPIRMREDAGYSFNAEEVLGQITDRTRMIIVNTPANPTGGVIQRAELQRLADGLEAHPQVYVLADEIYSRLLYDGEQHVSLLEFENIRERVILLDGWSKTWAMTGWRLGYGVWPKELIDHAERLQINSTSCTNAAGQIAAIEAMEGPQDAVDQMRAAFDERRAIIVEELNSIPGFSCPTPKGAFYAFPNTSGTGISSKELEDRLLQDAGVACLSGASFGAFGEGYMRFSYANSADNIREGIRRIRECLQPA